MLGADEGTQQSGGNDPLHAASRCRKPAGKCAECRLYTQTLVCKCSFEEF